MRQAASYAIVDEPKPGTLAGVAVDPMWPVLATMLGGTWLGFSWFIVNALAIGSASRKKEIALAVGGWAGTAALFGALVWLAVALQLDKAYFPYLRLVLVVWKLLVAYALQFSQIRSFELFTHFGGRGRNGVAVVIAGFAVRDWVAGAIGPLLGAVFL